MFKKLLSNLPFNPSLITQVSFYARRIRQEESLRRLGVVLLVLALAIQVFAVTSPPQATARDSANDIVRGGFGTQAEAVGICRQGASSRVPDFVTILNAYGISCDNLQAASRQYVRSTGTFTGSPLYSLGREAFGPTGRKGQPSNEQQVFIPGASTTLYMRLLTRWDTGAYSTYPMLVGHTDSGKAFAVMYDCGNLVTETPQPPPPPPAPAPTPAPTPPPAPVQMCPLDSSIPLSDNRCQECPNVSGILATNPLCKPCDKSTNNNDTLPCLTKAKAARNETQHIANANNTMAHAGDVIIYTLSTKNTSKVTAKAVKVEEDVNDILDYANITDTHGGNLTDDGIIRWPAKDITAGATLTHLVTVTVKSPIPQTPVSNSNPGTFDLTMTNVYGNVVNIKLPADTVKTVEVVTTTKLPNTGPGTSVWIGSALAIIIAYFFARTRLIAKELDIVRQEQTAVGGF